MEYFQHSMPCPHEKTHKNLPQSLPIQISQLEAAKDFYTCAPTIGMIEGHFKWNIVEPNMCQMNMH